MRYDVYILKSPFSISADIQTWVDAIDPTTAAFSVMAQCGLTSAYLVCVYDGSVCEGQFARLELPPSASSSAPLISYDYDL